MVHTTLCDDKLLVLPIDVDPLSVQPHNLHLGRLVDVAAHQLQLNDGIGKDLLFVDADELLSAREDLRLNGAIGTLLRHLELMASAVRLVHRHDNVGKHL